MTVPNDAIWAVTTIGLVLFLGSIAVDARLFRSRQKEQQFAVAIGALRQHYAAMRTLDDPQTPSELLDLALGMSRSLHDPKIAYAIEYMLRIDPQFFEAGKPRGLEDDENATYEAYRHVSLKRPDLAAAFVTAMTSLMAAFISRWPSCTPAFAPLLIELAAHPTQEAKRVVQAADAARTKTRAATPALAIGEAV